MMAANMVSHPAASARELLAKSSSRCLLAQASQECLLLLSGQEREEPRHRKQQGLRISVVQVGARQKVRADHLQAVTSGSVASQHQGRGLDRSFNDRYLALVKFEVDNFLGLCYFSCEFALHGPLKLLLRQLASFVQPGCTIEMLPIPAR